MARINKNELIKRVTLYRDGEQARVDLLNKQRQEKYESDRAKYEQELLPHFVDLHKVLDDTVRRQGTVPEKDQIPKYFRDNNWSWIFNGPGKPAPEPSKIEYYNTILAFLAAVADDTVSETAMAKAGFHDIGRFFAEPDSAYGNKHRARG